MNIKPNEEYKLTMPFYVDNIQDILDNPNTVTRICYIPKMYMCKPWDKSDTSENIISSVNCDGAYISIDRVDYLPFYFNNIYVNNADDYKLKKKFIDKLLVLIEDIIEEPIEEFTQGTFQHLDVLI